MNRPEGDGYELQSCRGLEGTCPFALVRDPSLAPRIDQAVRTCAWWPRFNADSGKARPHHARFRVALAACPNACTMPQIRDIGIIATVTPQAVRPECTGCGACERTCREQAMVVQDGRAVLQEDRCVGCGQCLQKCPHHVIDSGPVRLRLLVGGRMGRHPRWAEELCTADVGSAAAVVKAFLDRVGQEARSAETVADVVERLTLERLREEIAAMIGAAESVPSGPAACPALAGGASCFEPELERR